ncbi:MAG TPA: SpoVA/SpoVAEb family sporulation membrane protein, partial [Syntrophomonas sp.]|nr:SpoVA/SpoVAEb family sporulation membrane protein [Syntrophomonas sp.]
MDEGKSEELKAAEKKEYQNLVNQAKPKPSVLSNCLWAFVVGGLICVIAQVMLNYLVFRGMDKIDAGSAVA